MTDDISDSHQPVDPASAAHRAADGTLLGIQDHIEAEETLEYIMYWEKEHGKIKDHAEALRKRADDYEKRRLLTIEEKLYFHTERLKNYAAKELEHKKEKSIDLATGKLSFRKQQPKIDIFDEIKLTKWAAANNLLDSLFEKKEMNVPRKGKIKKYIEKTGEIPEGTDFNRQEDSFTCETIK